jgi:hypothetical protein
MQDPLGLRVTDVLLTNVIPTEFVPDIIVNFDLPWTIIRLIQRAGRVDRIGQKSDKILYYSFLPADGAAAPGDINPRC